MARKDDAEISPRFGDDKCKRHEAHLLKPKYFDLEKHVTYTVHGIKGTDGKDLTANWVTENHYNPSTSNKSCMVCIADSKSFTIFWPWFTFLLVGYCVLYDVVYFCLCNRYFYFMFLRLLSLSFLRPMGWIHQQIDWSFLRLIYNASNKAQFQHGVNIFSHMDRLPSLRQDDGDTVLSLLWQFSYRWDGTLYWHEPNLSQQK